MLTKNEQYPGFEPRLKDWKSLVLPLTPILQMRPALLKGYGLVSETLTISCLFMGKNAY